MKCHSILPDQLAEPWAPVKSYRQLTHLIHHHPHTPLFKLAGCPEGSVFISIRTDEPATETVTKNIQVFHGAVFGPADLHDLSFVMGFRYKKKLQI